MNKARAFNPFLCAATDNLKALITEVQTQMSGYEFFHQTRKRARRPADQANYDRTVEAILCDLSAVEFEPNRDSIHLPLSNKVLRSKSRYKGTARAFNQSAANGRNEPILTDAAECVNGCKWQGAGFRSGAGVCAELNAQGARNSAPNRCKCVSENEACFQLDGFDLSSFSHKFC